MTIGLMEIKVKNKYIADILLSAKNEIVFSTKNKITQGMRVKFFCEGACGRTYVEGIIAYIYSRQKLVDCTGFEYSCRVSADLILF